MTFDPDQFLADIQEAPADVIPPLNEIHEYGGEWRQCGPVLYLYRAVASCYDPYEYSGAMHVSFTFTRYRAVRFTPCGAWVTDAPDWYDKPKLRWVSLDNYEGKRLGYTDREKAMRSLKKRNNRHVQILRHQLACAEQVFDVLNPKAPK